MSTLSPTDIALMSADIAAIINERPLAAAIRRRTPGGPDVTLAAQTVRVVATGSSSTQRGQTAAAPAWPFLVLGGAALDIAVGDRLNDYNGDLIEVKAVHNDRRAFTQAAADLVQ